MNALARRLIVCLLACLVHALPARAEEPEDVPLFSQAELDQMLAPIALYPDQLLSQLLMASTYPLEIVEAARWSRANPDLKGQDAVRAVNGESWDPSVKAMVAFPDLLRRMDEDLKWTSSLGDAFLAQQEQVMDTVQALRQRAEEAGNLQSDEHVEVVREREVIVVRDRYPDIVYMPWYSPYQVYGDWWWPSYRPVYWDPWPGYYRSSYFHWGPTIVIGHGFYYGHCDWRARQIRVVEAPPFYYGRPRPYNDVWEHEYRHRRGVAYRDERVQQRYADNSVQPVRPVRPRHQDRGLRTVTPAGYETLPEVTRPRMYDGRSERGRDAASMPRDGANTDPVIRPRQGTNGDTAGRPRQGTTAQTNPGDETIARPQPGTRREGSPRDRTTPAPAPSTAFERGSTLVPLDQRLRSSEPQYRSERPRREETQTAPRTTNPTARQVEPEPGYTPAPQQRTEPAPRYEAPRRERSPQPSYTPSTREEPRSAPVPQPRPEPRYSAPPRQSYSAPSQPQSQPRYSAPSQQRYSAPAPPPAQPRYSPPPQPRSEPRSTEPPPQREERARPQAEPRQESPRSQQPMRERSGREQARRERIANRA